MNESTMFFFMITTVGIFIVSMLMVLQDTNRHDQNIIIDALEALDIYNLPDGEQTIRSRMLNLKMQQRGWVQKMQVIFTRLDNAISEGMYKIESDIGSTRIVVNSYARIPNHPEIVELYAIKRLGFKQQVLKVFIDYNNKVEQPSPWIVTIEVQESESHIRGAFVNIE